MAQELLTDKIALITGAAGGIGRAAARLFAEHGCQLALTDRDLAGAQDSARLASELGATAMAYPADLTQSGQVADLVAAIINQYGKLDILFNVAGISGRRFGDGPVHTCSEEAWDIVLDANLKSQFLCCKYVIPHMIENKGGVILNLSSVLGLVGGNQDFATHAYAASKGGIISLTRSIAAYYAKDHIRANVICPGLIATPMSLRAQSSTAIRQELAQLQPLTGDFGQPEDVAGAALYLASDSARFVTGAVLTVDGGWTVI